MINTFKKRSGCESFQRVILNTKKITEVNMIRYINKPEVQGQTLVEYALIIALIAVVLIAALTALSGGIGGTFQSATEALE
jgi:Flp pilus assembly pilin Flp